MPRHHARRRPSREGTKSTAHAGQAKSAPRKRLYRQRKMLQERQRMLTRGNFAQMLQNKVDCHIIIRGFSDWRDVFEGETTKVYPRYAKYFGTDEPPLLDYLRVSSDLNKVSHQRSIIGELLGEGFELEALEVEFLNPKERAWGLSKWHPSHSAYQVPLPEAFAKLDPKLFSAMFTTQHAGEQKFCLYSTQVGSGILLHKSVIFRKVILRMPTVKTAKAA